MEQDGTDDEEGDDRPDGGEASESVTGSRAGEGIDLSPARPMLSRQGKASPGSAIYSTVHDLQNLQAAQIKAYHTFASGGAAGPLILTNDVATTSLHHDAGQPAFGSGLIIIPHPKGPFYMHDGDADGFASVYVFSPKDNAGVVILTGSGGQWITKSAIEILVGLIDEDQES